MLHYCDVYDDSEGKDMYQEPSLILILYVVHLDLVVTRIGDRKPSMERYKHRGQYIISHHVALNGVLLICGFIAW